MRRARTGVALALLWAVLGTTACRRDPAAQIPEETLAILDLETTDMEEQVASRFQETRDAVLQNPGSAAAWGRFGMVAHAHELWDEAATAYRQAQLLDPGDHRWPYYLGDVLSVAGTDLEAAEEAFQRAMSLHPDYAPAHMRLGNVLVAAGRNADAAAQFERALELAPELEPARVALAQIRLAEGELASAAELLEAVLADSPRHGQALSTLAQVYGRQGRREEAREIALRARDPAAYNLFSDPVMSQVVAEGRSSVLLWERAKSYLDNGNYEQAVLGLRQVVALRPSNPEVHLQLAIAYGNLGELERTKYHLERTVALAPDLADAWVRLGTIEIERQNPAAAIPHLRKALELAPEDPRPHWLLGRALLRSGDLSGGMVAFEEATAAGLEAPTWVHNDWGSALAQTGRADAAMRHFMAALDEEPENAQANFYVGLLLEARGRLDEAADRYCRSLRSAPGSPGAARLQALDRSCD